MTKRAGNIKHLGSEAVLTVLAVWAGGNALGQVRQSAVQAQPTPVVRRQESTVTVQQIAARQEENFSRIKNAQGTVVWTIKPATGATTTRNIFFAFDGDKSVTLVLPDASARRYRQGEGVGPWGEVVAASLVDGDFVQSVSMTKQSTAPLVTTTMYNPAVHDNNPLARFHPRVIGDERVPLRELAAAVPQMAARPVVSDITYEGRPAVRIDFANPQTPGESIYYVVDPARAWMPLDVGRHSGGRLRGRSKVTIGRTKDGSWIPARRTRFLFDEAGKPAGEESWHYDYFAANEGLPPRTLSLAFFQLPVGTRYTGLPAGAGAGAMRDGTVAPPGAPAVGRVMPTPAAAMPRRERVAPAPITVPLR